MAKRMNPGKSADLPVVVDGIEFDNPENATLEIWTLYDRGPREGFRRWKLAAQEGTSVLGTANYTLSVKDTKLHTNDDGSALKKDRPGLFAIISELAAGGTAPTEPVSTANDPYGDDAYSRGQKLTQGQLWNRALLRMRETHLHWECRPDRDSLPEGVVRDPSWERGIRQSWFGVFRGNFEDALMAHKKSIAADAAERGKETGRPDYRAAIDSVRNNLTQDMPQSVLDDAVAFITKGNCRDVNFDEYTKLLKAFYDGAFHPSPMLTLAAKFDQLTGLGVTAEFVNVDTEKMADRLIDGLKETIAVEVDSFNELL